MSRLRLRPVACAFTPSVAASVAPAGAASITPSRAAPVVSGAVFVGQAPIAPRHRKTPLKRAYTRRKTAFVRRQPRPRGLFILGLTGVMGSGKSALGRELARAGAILWDADAEVARLRRDRQALLSHLRASALVLDETLLAEVGQEEVARRREALRAIALLPGGLEVLEGYFLPRLRTGLQRLLGRVRSQGRKLVVLDVPLLFEKGYLELTDFTINTNASRILLQRRLAKRRGLDLPPAKKSHPQTPPPSAALQLRLATAQWDLAARRKALRHSAGVIVETGLARGHTRRTSFAALPPAARRLLRS